MTTTPVKPIGWNALTASLEGIEMISDSSADGMIKKLISIFAWSIPSYFATIRQYISDGTHAALLLVAESSWELLPGLVQEYGGTIISKVSTRCC